MEAIIVAGSAGLIGKAVVEKLQANGEGNRIIGTDPKDHFIDLSQEYLLDRLFQEYEIVGFVNASYPYGFENHIGFFMRCTEEFAERMKRGSIVNLASIYGVIGPNDDLYAGTEMEMPAWYAAAKGAIIAYSRCLAARYAPRVRINCVSPGGVFNHQNPYFVSRYQAKVPMGRMACPKDVADAIAFLLSDDAAYITGQNLIVDGGLTSRI